LCGARCLYAWLAAKLTVEHRELVTAWALVWFDLTRVFRTLPAASREREIGDDANRSCKTLCAYDRLNLFFDTQWLGPSHKSSCLWDG
jgi:hypothetical protein